MDDRKPNEQYSSTAPLTNGRISYLFIMIHNFQQMLTFYREILGFQVNFIEDNECVFLSLPERKSPQIALYKGNSTPSLKEQHWFIVIDVDNINATVHALTTKGVNVGEIEKVPYGRAIMIKDPEGNVIEIHEPEHH